MRLVADGVYLLRGLPPNAINVYLVDDVLVDAGTVMAKRRILRQVRTRTVLTHALTHAHPDHFGSSHAVCEELQVPLWCGELDASTVESGQREPPDNRFAPLLRAVSKAPAHPVARRLREGDAVAGFRVLDAPGHSQGHLAFWRESDRTLIAGDVYFNLNPLTGVPGLREPPAALTDDPERNRESMRKLAELEPALVLFGHGPPLRDTRKFVEFGRSV
jgi:glyoxylase-like metal-dependent hydrolase (beta-lactamase superfamily II)